MIRRILFLTLIAFFLPLVIQAQTQVDPTRQIKWPLATGSGAPTGPCTTANYGQPYTDISASPYVGYVCGTTGWGSPSGGGTWPGYPGAGIVNSSGSAWSTSYSATNKIPASFLNLSAYQPLLGFTPYNATNPSGYITGINSSAVTTALGFTPYSAANPASYISGITSSTVTAALGFTPYNATNPTGYITASALSTYALTTALNAYQPALGFTPYNATNPAGYITASALAPYTLTSAFGTGAFATIANYLTTANAASTYLTTATAASTYAPKFSLTTSGTSGAATYSGNVLNVPQYTLTIPIAQPTTLGGIKPDNTTITVNATTGVASASGFGTVSGVWQRAGTVITGNSTNQYATQEPTLIYNSTGSPAIWEVFNTCGWSVAGLCYWTGKDPINLTAQNSGNAVISGVYHGTVKKISGTYYFMGVAYGASATSYVLYSSSSPATSWTLVHSGLIPALGSGTWDDNQKGNIDWWVDGSGVWQVLYEALGTDLIWRTGRATATASGVPTAFTAYGSNPVIAWGTFTPGTYPSGGMCGGPRTHYFDGSGNMYEWLHCDALGGSGANGDTPTELYRWKSLAADTNHYTWALDTPAATINRVTADEGPSNTIGAHGQIADFSAVEVNGSIYAMYDATDTQSPVAGDGIHVKLAVAPMTFAKLVTTQEGDGGVLSIFPGGNASLGTLPAGTTINGNSGSFSFIGSQVNCSGTVCSFGSALQTYDLFSGTNGTALTAHTDNSGHTWSDVSTLYGDTGGGYSAAALTGSNSVQTAGSAANVGSDYLNSVTPSSAAETVCLGFSLPNVIGSIHIFNRAVSGQFTNYLAVINGSTAELYYRHTGSATAIGTTGTISLGTSSHTVCLVSSGTSQSITLDGTPVSGPSGTDANLSSAGSVGFRISGSVTVTSFSLQ